MTRLVYSFLLLMVLLSCNKKEDVPMEFQDPIEQGNDSNIVNILFIGNSLTYFNEGIAFHVNEFYSVGEEGVVASARQEARPGYSLRNHLTDGSTQTALSAKDWDYIVLQENGEIASGNPTEMLQSVVAFKDLINANTDAQVFFYLTWAYDGRPEMTKQLLQAYTAASNETGYAIVPIGLGWRDFQDEENGINLLGPDGVHPSVWGTYFASAMLFRAISNQDMNGSSYTANLNPSEALYIREFATQSFLDYY